MDLFFCISQETCCPNWNKEQQLVKAIKLSDINEPLIKDESVIKKVDRTLLEYIQFKGCSKIDFPDYGKEPTRDQLVDLINRGIRCYYRYGFAYRGAEESEISREEALKLLPAFSYGMGFHNLKFKKKFGVPVLEFNDLGENDLY